MISIIIRAYNEERWISICLKAIKKQNIPDIEVVLVDNNSTDKTVQKAVQEYPDLILVTITNFLPGIAINKGIRASSGEFIAILSAHCIPTDENWLSNLKANLTDYNVAGVYGRQIPLNATSPEDARDLLLTFGLDHRIQVKDSFFHNANSMLKRSTWQKYPFDEDATNIEDRIWGQKIISSGLKIAYEPEASVYHHHGIHQKGDKTRLENVVRILNEYEILKSNKTNFPNNPEFQEVCAIIPLRANNDGVDSDLLFVQETINAVKKSKYIDRVILSTDSDKWGELGKEWGVEVPFIRPKDLSQSDVRIETVLKYSLEQLESQNYFPDIIVPLEITYPFRPDGLLDKVISTLCNSNFDTVIAGFPEFRPCWIKVNEETQRVDENSKARSMRHPTNIGLHSLACATYPEIIRKNGDRIGKSVGIIEVTNHLSTIEFRKKQDLQHFESLKLLFENTKKQT